MPDNALIRPPGASAATLALLEAATAAGYAPSIHNSRPWRWRLIGNVLDLHLERDRVLAGPDARLATLSCGVALHHARMALAAQGWRVTVVRLPDRLDRDHLAQVHIEGRTPIDPRSALHLRTIPLRPADRRTVTAKPVGPEQVQLIAAAVTAEDTWLHTVRPDQIPYLAGAPDHTRRVQTETSAGHRESAHRTGSLRPTGVGLPDAAIPAQTPRTTGPGRDVGHDGELPISIQHDRTAVFVLLYGESDEPLNWLRAGEALSAGWLTATENGMSMLPHSAPIEVLGTRRAMRAILAGHGYPYLVLRLGTIDSADAGSPRAARLPADQTIDRS